MFDEFLACIYAFKNNSLWKKKEVIQFFFRWFFLNFLFYFWITAAYDSMFFNNALYSDFIPRSFHAVT